MSIHPAADQKLVTLISAFNKVRTQHPGLKRRDVLEKIVLQATQVV